MIEYKLVRDRAGDSGITKDGHTMFSQDVLTDLQRLAYLETQVAKLGGTGGLLKLVEKRLQYPYTNVKDIVKEWERKWTVARHANPAFKEKGQTLYTHEEHDKLKLEAEEFGEMHVELRIGN